MKRNSKYVNTETILLFHFLHANDYAQYYKIQQQNNESNLCLAFWLVFLLPPTCAFGYALILPWPCLLFYVDAPNEHLLKFIRLKQKIDVRWKQNKKKLLELFSTENVCLSYVYVQYLHLCWFFIILPNKSPHKTQRYSEMPVFIPWFLFYLHIYKWYLNM